MEDLFGQIECRSKSDSIVMKILRSAMDKTHEKLQFTDGPIEFLQERTIFYELATILVEGGLNIVQDQESDILEGGCNKVVSDLVEIRQWLQGRIHDMKQLIVEKDRELVYLHEEMEPQGTKKVARDEEIFKLKSSVDQQMSNIKQKLEEEKKMWINERRMRRSRVSSPNLSFDFLDKERSGSLVMKEGEFLGFDNSCNLSRSSIDQKVLIKGMSSDIDILKETVDLAFGRMESGEMIPLEKQWRWGVERDVEMVMVKGFIRQVRGFFDAELKKKVGVLKKDLFYYIDENYMYNGNDASEKGGLSVRQTTSEPDLDSSYTENVFVEDVGDNRSHHVAKMIKNHESIICKQREQYKWLTREGLSSAKGKKDKDVRRQERRIQEAIMRFDNFSKRNENVHPKNATEQRRILHNETKTSKTSARVEKLEAERDGMCFQISVMEDIYNLLLKSMMKEIDASFLETILEKDVYKFVMGEALKDVHIDITEHNLQERTPRSWRLSTPRSRRVGGEGDESLIMKLDSLLMCLEEEEDLMLKASSMIKEHSVNNSLVILNCEEMEERNAIEWLITDDESTFNLVSMKLERALQQLYTSKELLAELEQSLEISDDFGIDDETPDQYSNNVLSIIVEFRSKFTNVEHMLHENLESKCLSRAFRLERLKHEVDMLTQPVGWMRRRKLLYKKAFITRCHNLKLAETEVDLLGDQVESLLYLLERIYHVLNRNATVFSCYSEVYDMLKLIRIELINNGRSCKPS